MNEELKNNLQQVSANLQSIASTDATVTKLIAGGTIRIVGVSEKEDVEPPIVTITGEDMIRAVLAPILRETSSRKERNLAAKESLLRALENELLGKQGDEEVVSKDITSEDTKEE